ncbi:MAG: hypothetical protein SVZ03_12325 [Spirochaetota bacterium]|nr:hypothetical protein [Spirochaetota bacterium]
MRRNSEIYTEQSPFATLDYIGSKNTAKYAKYYIYSHYTAFGCFKRQVKR